LPFISFRRKRRQLWQLQFHCGKPPPADEPSTLIFISITKKGKGLK